MCPSQTSQSTEWHLKCQPSFHWGEENTRFVCSDEIRTFLSPETPKDIQPTVKYHGEKQQIVTFKSLKHVSVSVFNLFFFLQRDQSSRFYHVRGGKNPEKRKYTTLQSQNPTRRLVPEPKCQASFHWREGNIRSAMSGEETVTFDQNVRKRRRNVEKSSSNV